MREWSPQYFLAPPPVPQFTLSSYPHTRHRWSTYSPANTTSPPPPCLVHIPTHFQHAPIT